MDPQTKSDRGTNIGFNKAIHTQNHQLFIHDGSQSLVNTSQWRGHSLSLKANGRFLLRKIYTSLFPLILRALSGASSILFSQFVRYEQQGM